MVALQEALAKIGLRLEMAKTDVLRVTEVGEIEFYHWNQDSKRPNLTEDANPEELLLKDPKATSLRYLGSQIGSAKKAVQCRITQANASFNQLHAAVWKRSNLSYKTKVKIFNAVVMSSLLYGLKCHALTRTTMKKLDFFCLNKLKCILSFEFDAKISYTHIQAELSFFNISWKWPRRRLQESRLQYFIKSMKNEEIRKIIIPEKGLKRKRGRPRFRYIDAIVNDLEDVGNIKYKEIQASFHFKSRAEKVIGICSKFEDTLLNTLAT